MTEVFSHFTEFEEKAANLRSVFFLIKYNKSFRTKYLSKSLFMFLLSFGLVKVTQNFGSVQLLLSFLHFFYNILPIYHQHHVSSSSPSVSLQKTKCVQKNISKRKSEINTLFYLKCTDKYIKQLFTSFGNFKKKVQKIITFKIRKKRVKNNPF